MMKISKNTGRILAKYGRKGKLERLQTNVLVNQGVYKYMRHPMHLGLFLFPIGVAFLIASPSFILMIAPIEIIFMLFMTSCNFAIFASWRDLFFLDGH